MVRRGLNDPAELRETFPLPHLIELGTEDGLSVALHQVSSNCCLHASDDGELTIHYS